MTTGKTSSSVRTVEKDRMSEKRRCLYEVLEVRRNAEPSDIRKAYKQLALKLHPDKNHDDPHAAKKFQELNAAYAVLSDVHERAFYDSHRESILRGDSAGISREDGEPVPEKVNLWPYFSTSCYEGFDDSEGGFYAVYRLVFSELAEPEVEEGGVDPGEIPGFGASSSPWEEVHEFYCWWSSFVSNADFRYAERYNVAEAPNRRIRRLMEKENKKERDVARKKHDTTVKHLVSFVRVKDPRVRAYNIRRQREQLRLAEEKLAAAEMERLRRQQRQKELLEEAELLEGELLVLDDDILGQYVGDEEARPPLESWWHEKGKGAESDDEDERNIEFYCFVCNKKFMSRQQWENHGQSKKHNAQVESLRAEVLISGDDSDEGEPGDDSREAFDFEESLASVKISKGREKRKKKQMQRKQESDYVEMVVPAEKAEPEAEKEDVEAVRVEIKKKPRRRRRRKDPTDPESPLTSPPMSPRKSGGKGTPEGEFVCRVCGHEFPGRNAMFKHLKQSGHATAQVEGASGKVSKRRRD